MYPFVTIDFETRSTMSIKAGASKYSKHCEVMCLSYQLGDDPEVYSWAPGEREPVDLLDAIASGCLVHAWNASFEINVWQNVMVPKFGWPEVKLKNWRCTMAEALYSALPGSLEESAKVLGLPVEKDMKGRRLMLKMSKPRKPTKNDKSPWHEKPEQKASLRAYCDQDVRTEFAVHTQIPRLSKREQSIYLHDRVVNQRGVKIDVDLAESAVDLWDQFSQVKNAEVEEKTFGLITSTSEVKMMTYAINRLGCGIPNLQAQTIKDYLEIDISPTVRFLLEARRDLGLSSIAKYKKMLQCVEDDGRIHGCLQYYGAQATGRYAGRMVQLQNLPRGSGSVNEDNTEELISLVKTRDLSKVQECEIPLGDLLSSLIRPTIIADEGKKLVVSDFASVEARGLAWAAGESWLLDAFRNGEDCYKHMASDIYKVPYSEVTKDQRFYGKQAVLGCFGPDTKVLTNHGWKPITDVKLVDKLWDGVEWVTHQGVMDQGVKTCLRSIGVSATSDHLCLSKKGWMPWEHVTQLQNFEKEMLWENLPSTGFEEWNPMQAKNATCMKQNALVAIFQSWISRTLKKAEANCAMPVGETRVGTLIARNTLRSTYPLYQTKTTGADYSTGCRQRYQDATIQKTKCSNTMDYVEYKCISLGETIGQSFWSTFKHFLAGMNQIGRWTGLTTTSHTSLGTYDSPQSHKTLETDDGSRISKNSLEKQKLKLPTYDIYMAGPRNRYTILTDYGPMVVHNCGYQLGAIGFQNQLAGYGVEAEDELCQAIIKAYRSKNKAIRSFWYDIEGAAVECVKTGRARRMGPYVFYKDGDWMRCRMPSGRDISFYRPRLVPGKYDNEQIEYIGIDTSGRPFRKRTYGGMLTENVTQALCRDLLVAAMSRLERAGYPVIAHVHDEVILEVDENFGSAEEVNQIMSEVPEWAKGFPVSAEGFETKRFRKD